MSISLHKLAQLTGATLKGAPDYEISSVADLDSATPHDATFISGDRYLSLLSKTQAGMICISPTVPVQEGKNFLISDNPSETFQELAKYFLSKRKGSGFEKIHPSAVIHPSATIGKAVQIGPYCVVEQDAVIGKGTTLYPFSYIGVGTEVGEQCTLYPHSSVREYCSIGDRVILQQGAVVGSCGFGYTTSDEGVHTKLEQLGNVIIEDDVEIGANTTIDRARFKTTKIGRGTKIDNLVQIAHNVELGECNIIAAQTGIAGSTKTGRNVMMGGQVGVVGHLEITDFVMIATRGGVSKSIKTPGKYAGSPVVNLEKYNRTQVHLRKSPKRMDALEKNLSELRSSCN